MTTQNLIIGFPRLTGKLSVHAGSVAWNTTYPNTNALTLPLSQIARSVDATTAKTQIKFDLDKARTVGVVALVGHNLSKNALWQIKFWSTTARGGSDLLFDTGAMEVWPAVFAEGSLPWGDERWFDGKYTAEDIAGYTWTTPYLVASDTLLQPVAIDIFITDTANADGHIDLGLVEVAAVWQLSINPDVGLEYGPDSFSTESIAFGGTRWTQRMRNQRGIAGQVTYIDHSEAMSLAFEMARIMDITEPMLVILDPLDTPNLLRNCWLGYVPKLSKAKRALGAFDTIPINFAEVL